MTDCNHGDVRPCFRCRIKVIDLHRASEDLLVQIVEAHTSTAVAVERQSANLAMFEVCERAKEKGRKEAIEAAEQMFLDRGLSFSASILRKRFLDD